MSNDYDDDLDIGDDDGQDAQGAKGLRRAAGQSAKLKSENATLKRELAFAKAGLDLADPRMGYFVRGYEGELEPKAIMSAATEAGFVTVKQDTQQTQQSQQAAVAQQQIGDVINGAPVVGGGSSVEDRMDEAFRTGGTEAMLEVVRQAGIPVQGMSQ